MQAITTNTRKEWLNCRRKGVGGSDVGAILGLNRWRTALDVFNDKTGREFQDVSNQPAVHFGTILEDIVAKEFEQRTGMKVQRIKQTLVIGENGWMRANIDRAIVNPDIARTVRVRSEDAWKEDGRLLTTDMGLECKTASAYTAAQWGASQEDEIVAGAVFSEHEVPVSYELQCQWYMAITGARVWYLAVLIGGQDYRIYEIQRNEILINTIIERCREFWFNNVLADVAPEPVSAADIEKVYPDSNGEMMEALADVVIAIGEIRNIDAQMRSLKLEREQYAEQIKEAIAERDGLLIGGERAATWKSSSRSTVDTKMLKQRYPNVYDECLRETKTRTLRIY